MEKPEAILFDMGGTLIEYSDFNPLQGTKKILEEAANNPNNVTAKEVQDFADELNQELDNLKNERNIEVSCSSFYRLIFEIFGVELEKSPYELEVLFKNYAWKQRLITGVSELLKFIKKEGIRSAVLSNSCFSKKALQYELSYFSIQDYFEFVISSAEYCIRKPDKRIFELALVKFNLNADEVWYVGNTFTYDVMGAYNASIQPIWYNANNLDPETDIPYYEINNHIELINKLKSFN